MRLRMQSNNIGYRSAVVHVKLLQNCSRSGFLPPQLTQESLTNTGVIQVYHLPKRYRRDRQEINLNFRGEAEKFHRASRNRQSGR